MYRYSIFYIHIYLKHSKITSTYYGTVLHSFFSKGPTLQCRRTIARVTLVGQTSVYGYW